MHQGRDLRQRRRVEAEFGLVENDGRGWVRLEQERRERNEAQRAVRQVRDVEERIAAAMTPAQADRVQVESLGAQNETAEERRDAA